MLVVVLVGSVSELLVVSLKSIVQRLGIGINLNCQVGLLAFVDSCC